MTKEEKFAKLEEIMGLPSHSLTKNTMLEDLEQWDSLTITNLQIELTLYRDGLTFRELKGCKTAGDLCLLFE